MLGSASDRELRVRTTWLGCRHLRSWWNIDEKPGREKCSHTELRNRSYKDALLYSVWLQCPANCYHDTVPGNVDSRQEILRTAARLFQQHGYDATSMNDVAAALKLSKGGLYHHFQSKDEILFNLMNHAMDITQDA